MNEITSNLYPIILAGGSGTRLWPLSRTNFPKQFLCLQGEESLLQQTFSRIQLLPAAEVIVVSNEAHYFLCQEQLPTTSKRLSYLLEPCPRNTAPAIACTAYHLLQTKGSDAIMAIFPSDHWIEDTSVWLSAINQGVSVAANYDQIVTFGIKPTSPKTGYGYIEMGESVIPNTYAINSFHEKPDEAKAKHFLEQGDFFWNSGMFLCKAQVYLDELKKYAPDIVNDSQKAYEQAVKQNDFIRLNTEAFSLCRSESIDYALMEKTTKATLIPINLVWSDLGCWSAVAESHTPDEEGNILSGNVFAKDSVNCLIRSDQKLVATLGIRDQIIIATSDAVLVADKRYSQQVKELVSQLTQDQIHLTQDHVRVNRPWGYYEILAEGSAFKVKRLMVKPGAKLSLQMHQHRAEHWVIVEGEAEVFNDGHIVKLGINQSTYIPQRTQHRLSNPGNEPLYVIEVQSGHYLGEDDIQRFDDIYHRNILA